MIVECPNCKNSLRVKKVDDEFICYKCGTIISGETVTQIGVTNYKFKDDDQEYIIVFNDAEDLQEFMKIAEETKAGYKLCKITTPTGTTKIV